MTIKITPIGSCRIHNPLKKFMAQSHLQLNSTDVYGFTHTSSEALQQLKYLQGDYLPTESIQPILSPRLRFNKTKNNQMTPASDLYFVEISSAKTIKVQDEFVQMNYIHVYFSEFFLDPNRSKTFWSLAQRGNKEEMSLFLDETTIGYSKEKKELLAKLSVKQMTEEELRQDMMEIVKRVKQVVFVTHCNVTLADMTAIHSRKNWIQSIEKIGKELGCKIYNPTHLMMSLGQSLCLQKNGLDSTHYTSLFEQQIFNDLKRLYIEPLCLHKSNEEGSQNDHKDSMDEFHKLEQLFLKGEVSSALQQLNNFLRKYPTSSPALELMGRILVHLHDYERAIHHFKSLDDNQELSNEGRLNLVKSYFNLNHFQEVLNHAALLFEEEIYEPLLIKLSALASFALGQTNKASIYWEQLYAIEGHQLEAARALALLYEQNNEFESATFWIQKALEGSPTDTNLRAAFHRLLGTIGNEKSLELLIDTLNPMSEDELIAIGRSAQNHGFIWTAARSLSKANEIWPNLPKLKKMITNTVAEWLNKIEQETDSHLWLQYLKSILLIQPRNTLAIRLKRKYIINQKEALKTAYLAKAYDKAIDIGLAIYCLDPNNSGITLDIGRSYFANQCFPEALKWFIKTTDLNKNNNNAWILRVRSALKANHLIEALTSIEQIPKEFSEANKRLITGVITASLKEINRLMSQNEWEEAWVITEVLKSICPEEERLWKTKHLILKSMVAQLKTAENSDKQIQLAKSIDEKDPNNSQALRILAMSLMKERKFKESLSYWEKLCVLFPTVNSYKVQAEKCMGLA